MRRFLFINPFGIGDVLFTTPVIRSIKKAYPDSFIGYWCNERVEAVLATNPHIDHIYAFSRGDLKKVFRQSWFAGVSKSLQLFDAIKNGAFDISLDFSLDHRYSFISRLAGIKGRVGFDYKGRGRNLTDKIPLEGYSGKHVIEHYLGLLSLLAVSPDSGKTDLFVSKSDILKADDLLGSFGVKEDALLIGIAAGAGASWGKDASLKHWPAEKFAQLAKKIYSELGIKVLILGDTNEKHISGLIIGSAQGTIIDLTGKTGLRELAAVLCRCKVLVANDGGPLHMAVALGVKTVSLFGPVDEMVYGPYPRSSNHLVIKKDIDCRPCYNNFRLQECQNNRRCLSDISVEEVFKTVKDSLPF